MTLWIEDDVVYDALGSGNDGSLLASGVPFCVSEDRRCCVLVREHSAWLVRGEGWRDANSPPGLGEQGRLVLNFYRAQQDECTGVWFKAFVPIREGLVELALAGESSCTIRGAVHELHLRFDGIDRLMWQLMTGHAQPEEEIERLYSLIGEE